MKTEKQIEIVQRDSVRPGNVEGIILVNGRPQIERADMPLAFSFDSIEDLERFCAAAKSKGQN